MNKVLKNIEMVQMLKQLQPLLSYKDIFGYAAARNTRKLLDCLTEYDQAKTELIERFGEKTKNPETGAVSISIKIGTPAFESFCKAMEPFDNIEHEIDIMTVRYEDTINHLSGEEILNIEWMLTE